MRPLAAVILTLALGRAVPNADVWRAAPEYARLFAPAGPRGASYRTYVTNRPLSDVLRELGDTPALLRSPGAWQPRPAAPLDAFGITGRYDHWRLLLLYGASRPMVARGAATGPEGGESWTLISPYPDPALARLEPGTLLIVLSLARP